MIRQGIVSKDLPAIYEINEICHPSTRSEPRISLLEKIRSSEIWVYIVEDKIVGFLIGTQTTPYGPANLYNIAVLPDYRNEKIATKLMNEFEEFYKGKCVYYYLHVDIQNPAQKLYFNSGYRAFELKHDFYGDGTVALKMVKTSRI